MILNWGRRGGMKICMHRSILRLKKTDEQIDEEFEELTDEFSPYYELNYDLVSTKKRQFVTEFNDQLEVARRDQQYVDVQRRPDTYEQYGLYFIDRILGEGILEIAPEHAEKGKDFVINVVKGNQTQQTTIESIWGVEEAKDFLSDSLPFIPAAEPDFLLPLLEHSIVPTLFFNDSLTTKIRRSELESISEYEGMVNKGDLIVPQSGIVTQNTYQRLISFRDQYEREVSSNKSYVGVFFGYFLLTSLIVGVFLAYLRFNNKRLFSRFSEVFFMLTWLAIYSYLVYAVEAIDSLSVYMIPFCIVPIVVKNFYDERLALFTHVAVVLIASFLSSEGYEFTFLQILAGIVTVLSDLDTRNWTKFFSSLGFIFLAYALGYLGLSLIEHGEIFSIDYSPYLWLFLSVFLTLLAYPLIPLLERIFGFVSSITLLEWSDLNRPLLKELSLKAPGTFQHSLQVANLAEAAATAIGANALLAKVGALYHDMGKTINPSFFIENQNSEFNPHSELSNFESAKIIIDHVNEGLALAKKNKLPRVLTQFIATHHGTTRVEYFYRNELKQHPNETFDESLFRYPGPKPSTKEQSIMMMADSIEAASKSLKNPTGQDIDVLVDKIVEGKITNHQLVHSLLSFQELQVCKNVFKKLLRSINHVRVEYPEDTNQKG